MNKVYKIYYECAVRQPVFIEEFDQEHVAITAAHSYYKSYKVLKENNLIHLITCVRIYDETGEMIHQYGVI